MASEPKKTRPTVQRYPFESDSPTESNQPPSIHFNAIWLFLIVASAAFAFTFAASDELNASAAIVTVVLTGLNMAHVKRNMNDDLLEGAMVLTALPTVMVALIGLDRHLG